MEEREVAEILVRHRLVEVAQFIGHVLLVVHEVGDFVRDAPIEAFDVSTGFKVNDTVAEEVERFVADILCVVPVFEHGARGEFVPNLREVAHKLVVALGWLEVLGHVRHRGAFEHVEDKHGVVRRQRAAAFGDKVGVGDIVFVGCVGKGIDAVVHVFLDRIVHRTFGVA